jgi:hypothetical protein
MAHHVDPHLIIRAKQEDAGAIGELYVITLRPLLFFLAKALLLGYA